MNPNTISKIIPKIVNILNEFKELGSIDSVDMKLVNRLTFRLRYFTGTKSYAIRIICAGYLAELNKALLFDIECIENYQEDYGRLIQQLIKISNSSLQNIKFEIEGKWPDEEPIIKIVFNNRKYEAKLKYYGDYADSTGLITLLNRVLEDIKYTKRFYHIIVTEGQDANIFFLTEKEYKYLKSVLGSKESYAFLDLLKSLSR